MPLTVRVSAETKRLLDKLKKDMGLDSYDEIIHMLAKKETGIPRSLFGACKSSKSFKKEVEAEHRFWLSEYSRNQIQAEIDRIVTKEVSGRSNREYSSGLKHS